MTTIDVSQQDPEEVGIFIEQKVLETDQSEVVFEDIPDRFNWLEFYMEPTVDDNNAGLIRFNDDTGDGNYESYEIQWASSADAWVRSDGRFLWLDESDKPVRGFTLPIFGLNNPDMKTTYMVDSIRLQTPNARIDAGWWDDDSVVSKIELIANSTQFDSGSKFTLFGVE